MFHRLVDIPDPYGHFESPLLVTQHLCFSQWLAFFFFLFHYYSVSSKSIICREMWGIQVFNLKINKIKNRVPFIISSYNFVYENIFGNMLKHFMDYGAYSAINYQKASSFLWLICAAL